MNRRGFLAGAATALVAGAGCIGVRAAETTETDRYDIEDEAVTVANPEGDVTVRTGDRDDVRVRATKRDDFGNEDALSNLSVETSRSDGVFAVEVVDGTDPGMADATSVDLRVRLPEGTPLPEIDAEDDVDVRDTVGDLTVDGDDGDVTLRRVDGSVTVDAEDGDVSIRDIEGAATADLEDGDLRARAVAGDVTATLEDGDTTVRNAGGTVAVETQDGDVTVSDPGAVGDVTLEDGDADLEIPAVDGTATVSAEDGNLDLALAPDLDAEVTVRVDHGDIEASGFDFVAGDDVTGVETTVGDGASSLIVSTDDGDVTLTRL